MALVAYIAGNRRLLNCWSDYTSGKIRESTGFQQDTGSTQNVLHNAAQSIAITQQKNKTLIRYMRHSLQPLRMVNRQEIYGFVIGGMHFWVLCHFMEWLHA
jgi:hypothetical protein